MLLQLVAGKHQAEVNLPLPEITSDEGVSYVVPLQKMLENVGP